MQHSINSINLSDINEQILYLKKYEEVNFEYGIQEEIKKESIEEDENASKRANASEEDLNKLANAQNVIGFFMPEINNKLKRYNEKQNSSKDETLSDKDQAVLNSANNLIQSSLADKTISAKYDAFMKKYYGESSTNSAEKSNSTTQNTNNLNSESSDIFSTYQSMVNKVRIKNGIKRQTSQISSTNTTGTTPSTSTTQTTQEVAKLTKLGNELLSLQNELAELVESAKSLGELDAEDPKYQAYTANYTELYNKLVAKKEEYDNYAETLSNIEIKKAKNNLTYPNSDIDNNITDIDILSSETKLNKLPNEIVEIVNELLDVINRRQVMAYQTAALAEMDFESAEMAQLKQMDREFAQKEMEFQNKLAKYIQDNNVDTQSTEFQNMFAHFNASMDMYSEDLAYKIETIEEHIKAATIKQNSTEIDEAERTQTKAIQQIYEMELINLKTQQTSVEQKKNTFKNYNVEENIQTKEQINLNLKNLDYQYQIAEYTSKIQVLSYQLAELIDIKATPHEIANINNQILNYENQIKNVENAIVNNNTRIETVENEHLNWKNKKVEYEKLIEETYQKLGELTAGNVSATVIQELNNNLYNYQNQLANAEYYLQWYN